MIECHVCECSGQSPADADLRLLDIARKIEHYGLRLYPAKVELYIVIVIKSDALSCLFRILISYQQY